MKAGSGLSHAEEAVHHARGCATGLLGALEEFKQPLTWNGHNRACWQSLSERSEMRTRVCHDAIASWALELTRTLLTAQEVPTPVARNGHLAGYERPAVEAVNLSHLNRRLSWRLLHALMQRVSQAGLHDATAVAVGCPDQGAESRDGEALSTDSFGPPGGPRSPALRSANPHHCPRDSPVFGGTLRDGPVPDCRGLMGANPLWVT